jgi:hypothetical protein
MSTLVDSYVSSVLSASPAPGWVLDATARKWRWLSVSLFDSYRPEQHYMRGPGPKWRAKHERGASCASEERLKPNRQRVNRGTHRDEPRL